MYPGPGSNRYFRRNWCLRPARLPIPPPGQAGRENKKHSDVSLINYSRPNALNTIVMSCPDWSDYSIEDIDVVVIAKEAST